MYKYKLKEIEVGDVDISKGKKSTVSSVDDLTGSIEWDIIDVADFTSTFKTLLKAKDFLAAFETTGKTKDDKVIDGFSKQMTKIFNEFRTHIRANYPEEYKRVKNLKESNIEEKKIKGADGKECWKGYRYNGTKDGKDDCVKVSEDLEVEEGEGIGYLTPNAFRRKGQKANDKAYKELGYTDAKEGIGADLGPGPKASEDGVKDNAYVKQFKYKLVPKNKSGNYVQKGSGLEVKQLFQEATTDVGKHQLERIEAFDRLESEVENILPLVSNAKTETEEYYANKPKSYAVVYSTDAVFELLKDIKSYLTNNTE